MTPDELEKLRQKIRDAEGKIRHLTEDDDFRWLAEKMRDGNETHKKHTASDEIKTLLDESYFRGLEDILACVTRRAARVES